MPSPVVMPKLGLTMTEGKVVQWKKRPGDWVEKGEVLFVLETEKITYEVTAPASGVLGEIVVKEGETVPVGTVVAYILEPGEVPAEKAPVSAPPEKERLKASPLARRIAEEHGIDLSQVKGTGPGGRIVKEDVLRVIAEREKAPTEGKGPVTEAIPTEIRKGHIVPPSTMRRTIARRMTQSFTTAPHFYLGVEADAGELIDTCRRLSPWVEKAVGVRLTYTDLIIKMAAKALSEYPQVNASWEEEGIRVFDEINIGLAVAVEGGLVVPVIFQADKKPLHEIAALRADLTERARQGKLSLDEMTGSTFTVTNIGMLGMDFVLPIINPPEAAILGVGAIREKPVVVEGEVKVRPRLMLTLGVDHRILDGASVSPFLSRIKELVEQPLLLVS